MLTEYINISLNFIILSMVA